MLHELGEVLLSKGQTVAQGRGARGRSLRTETGEQERGRQAGGMMAATAVENAE